MNKKELVAKAAAKTMLSQSDTAKTLTAVIETIIETLSANERVALLGFGSFSVKERKARKGRNPANGTPVDIPAKNVVRFSPSETGWSLKPIQTHKTKAAKRS